MSDFEEKRSDNVEMSNEDELSEETENNLDKEINESGDGGVMKKILKEGSGFEFPPHGSEVTVHYVGRLTNGTVFDSNKSFMFHLGKGEVIKGWDQVVKGMKKGEKSLVTLQPEYAYGASGSPPTIPPNAILQFEIELLSWNSKEDILKDGGIMKNLVREGEGWKKPKDDEKVKINYILRKGEFPNEYSPILEEKKDFTFTVGGEEVIVGLDKAVQEMKRSEKASFAIQPQYAYGSVGKPELNIQPGDTLTYEIELLDCEHDKDTYEMSFEEKCLFSTKKEKKVMNSLKKEK